MEEGGGGGGGWQPLRYGQLKIWRVSLVLGPPVNRCFCHSEGAIWENESSHWHLKKNNTVGGCSHENLCIFGWGWEGNGPEAGEGNEKS